MKQTFAIITCVLIFGPQVSLGRDEPLANEDKAGLYARSIEEVLRISEDEVDLATAALIISEQWSDMVHGRRHLSALDDMALEIRDRLIRQKLKANFQAIPLINKYLFDECLFQPISEAIDPNDLFLHSVLDKKRGYCLSLSILYLSLAERLGLPLYGVVVPGHFFVRYDDGRVRFNIETTGKGSRAPDEYYVNKFKVPQGHNSSIYMRNLNKIQTLGCLFNNLGNVYSDIGNYELALLALVRAVEINPTLSESRSNLGNVYLKKGLVDDAIYQYQAALEINPNDHKTYNNLGNAYTERGWLNYAVAQYLRSLELDPNFIDAYKNLAIVYCKQERYGQAILQLKQAIAIQPNNADCRSQLGDVYGRMGNYEEATSEYKKALAVKPNFADAIYGLALCYNKLGMVDDEIAAYKKVLAIKPDMLAALVNLGNAYFGQKKFASAIEQYKKAARIKPDEASIHFNLGAAYSNSKNYEQAVAAYLRAVEIDPQMADAHYGLAVGFYQLKNYDLAWKHIKIAQQLGAEVSQDQLNAIKSKLK
ncbi:MAG: tetratricopeptide repeat protein [Planctomycetota bacterium]|nr:tetratricopeptide repeat protein [Planctomycetota bacterium]